MTAFFNDPNHWREQARKTRAVAKQVTLPEAGETLLRIATQYQEMAQWAEGRVNDASKPQPF
jgi:hypothetical protein